MFFIICLLLISCNLSVQRLNFVIKLSSFLVPIISLFFLSDKPCIMFLFKFLYFLLKFINVSLVKAKHLLNFKV
jgi:hypothetical protein